jgi:hypothetical protein
MPGPTSTDTNFERTFADLAYARLRDKAPSMLDYLVGFQLIDKNDEETRAIGVFGFKVGPEWVYAPVFFINGELKGHELMYMKEQDAFVPMTEEWVNYTLNRRPSLLGEAETTPRNDLPLRQPDFDVFARSPHIGSKYASARPTFNEIYAKVRPEYRPFMEVFAVSPGSEKYASLGKRLDLATFIKAGGPKVAFALVNTMRHDERFADAVLSFYKLQDLMSFDKSAKIDKAAAGYQEDASFNNCRSCDNYEAPRSCSAVEGDISPDGTSNQFEPRSVKNELVPIEPIKAAAERTVPMDSTLYRPNIKGKVVVITSAGDLSAITKDLSEADRRKLMSDQYIVKDERSDDRRSRVYRSQLPTTLQGPIESGVYDVMMGSGEARRAWVVIDPIRVGYMPRLAKRTSLVVDPESKQYGNYHPADILTLKQEKRLEDLPGLVSASGLSYDDEAMLIGPENKATGIFRVSEVVSNSDGTTELKIWGCNDPSSSASSIIKSRAYEASPSSVEDSDIRAIVLTDKDGKVTRIGETLFVPKSFKAFVIQKGKPRDKNYPTPVSSSSSLTLGALNDVILRLSKSAEAKENGIHRLQLRTDGISYACWLDGKPGKSRTKLASLKHLIEDHGLGQEDAETLVKEARPRHAASYFIKYAQQPTPGYFPEPMLGSEYGMPAPVQYPQTELQNLGNIDNHSNRDYYRDDRYVDNQARQYASQAASLGQKEILDTAVIGGLVRTMDSDSAVDGYIGDMLLGLDRVGRILFMYYWHNDKFKERYGQQDMIELEDNLRNVFKNLGELTLFLKQKTIEPDKSDSSEVELSQVLG